ncbi:MAG: DUF1572 family protein [bacterium]|nr:DUF1572 family protein [bacterium]
MLTSLTTEFTRYRLIGEKALAQISEADMNRVPGATAGNNSIAMIVRHLGGNLLSRFTDFTTTDGEKPWRDRDAEFEERHYSQQEVYEWWNKGWNVLQAELTKLTDADLIRTVTIRGVPLTVSEALTRSVAHVAYHVGQIVMLARIASGEQWQWISIPRGESKAYNLNPTKEKKPE